MTTTPHSPLRTALTRLAEKWTAPLPGRVSNRYHYFGDDLATLLEKTPDTELEAATNTLTEKWNNTTAGVPPEHENIKIYFANDVRLAVRNHR